MTQEELGKLLGVHQTYISKMMNGYLRPGKLRAQVWEPITGWSVSRWQKAKQADIQKLLTRIGGNGNGN